MDWIKLTIFTKNIEETCAVLSAAGHDQIEIDDPDELEDFIKNKKPYWQLVDEGFAEGHRRSVSIYLPEDANLSEFEGFDFVCTAVREQDWMDNWKQYYKPITIGSRILIQPEWEPLDNPGGRAVFMCDPGVSFGTGTHATTRMCLEYLDELVKPGDRLIDLGCGSGILSVTSMLLGASQASAYDIDTQAVDTALRNAERNNTAVSAEHADLLEDTALWARLAEAPADIVCANLVADLITSLSKRMKTIIKNGGSLLISGILEENSDNVCGHLEREGFFVKNKKFSEGWLAARLLIDI